MRLDVGIGDMKISNNTDDEIKTYALGSCVAIIIYDNLNKVAGMMHVALPDSNVNKEKAAAKPGYFVDTGLPVLLKEMERKGARPRSCWIKITGGATILDEKKMFDIGRRNVLAIKKVLWGIGLGVIKEDVGGSESRTVTIDVETGSIHITNAKRKWTL